VKNTNYQLNKATMLSVKKPVKVFTTQVMSGHGVKVSDRRAAQLLVLNRSAPKTADSHPLKKEESTQKTPRLHSIQQMNVRFLRYMCISIRVKIGQAGVSSTVIAWYCRWHLLRPSCETTAPQVQISR